MRAAASKSLRCALRCSAPRIAIALTLAMGALASHAPAQSDARTTGAAPEARKVATITPVDLYDAIGGVVSPDGRHFAYGMLERGSRRLWLLDLETGARRLLTPRAGSRDDVTWSPDGAALAYVGSVLLPDATMQVGGLWILDVGTGREQLVYPTGRWSLASSPRWAPDGRLVFQYQTNPLEGKVEIRSVRTDGTDVRTLTDDTPSDELPSISPDGRFLAYLASGCNDTRTWGVWIAERGRPPARCLAAVERRGQPPVWAPDSRHLYYVAPSPEDSLRHAYALDVVDGTLRRVDSFNADVTQLSVSREGRITLAIYWPRVRIGTVPASGGVPRPVLDESTVSSRLNSALPLWSLDGRALAYGLSAWRRTAWSDTDWEWRVAIVPVNADGRATGQPRVLEHLWDTLATTAWSPGRRCVAYGTSYQAEQMELIDVQRAPRTSLGPVFMQPPASYQRGFGRGPLWSRDGRLVVQDVGRRLAVSRVDSASCVAQEESKGITLSGFRGTPTRWRLSPDGQWLAFSRERSEAGSGIFLVPIDGGDVRTVVRIPRDDSFGGPEWSSDGRALYYAAADSVGHYRIYRHWLESGITDTVTRGPVSAMHPRLSPDGRTLAVTLWEAPTEVWEVTPPEVTVARQSPNAPSPPPAPPAPVTQFGATAPDDRLLDVAVHIAKAADELARRWPGYWRPKQAYLLYAPELPGALYVGEEPDMVGFQPVTSPALSPSLRARVYWRSGIMQDPSALGVPYARIAALPASGGDVVRWREQVIFDLLFGPGDRLGIGTRYSPPRAPERSRVAGPLCPSGEPRSCTAMRRLAHRVLMAAMDASDRELRDVLLRYAALRWYAINTGNDPEWMTERHEGMKYHLARRGAIIAAGGDFTRYQDELRRELLALPVADTGSWEVRYARARMEGEAMLLLLERIGYPWFDPVQHGAPMSDVLARAVALDSTQVLTLVKAAQRQFGYADLLAAIPERVDTTAEGRRQAQFRESSRRTHYWQLGKAIAGDSVPLAIQIPVPDGRSGGMSYSLTFDPGSADSVALPTGFMLLPSPESFSLDVGDVRIRLRHVPVAVEPKPGNAPGTVRITIFLHDSIAARIRDQRARSTGVVAWQRVRDRDVELEIGPRAAVSRMYFGFRGIFINP